MKPKVSNKVRFAAGFEPAIRKEFFVRGLKQWIRKSATLIAVISLLTSVGLASGGPSGETWSWKTETVDQSGKATSIRVDDAGNIHLSYGTDQEDWKYAFRAVGSERWDKMVLGTGGVDYTGLALDKSGNPHVCATYKHITYARFDGKKWEMEDINTDGAVIQYSCSVAIAPDGTPYLSWYKDQRADKTNYLHMKVAVRQEKVWVVQTLDFDMQTGKWHSMLMDEKGVPHISYDAFVDGHLKYAVWDGKGFQIRAVDNRAQNDPEYNVGMGNSLALDAQGRAHISYYTTHSLRYVSEGEKKWTVQTVDMVQPLGSWIGYRSALAIDSTGMPHIAYQDGAAIKHAYWDGKDWQIQLLVPSGEDLNRYLAMAIGKDDRLYLVYRDPSDGSLRVAIGTRRGPVQTTQAEKK